MIVKTRKTVFIYFKYKLYGFCSLSISQKIYNMNTTKGVKSRLNLSIATAKRKKMLHIRYTFGHFGIPENTLIEFC